MNGYLKIYEVGPRDGLQNEAKLVETADKKQLVDGLVQAGLRYVETNQLCPPQSSSPNGRCR